MATSHAEDTEIWREVPGSDGQYSVSSWGRLRTNWTNGQGGVSEIGTPRWPRPHPVKGYCFVTVRLNGRRVHTGVHKLVALAFLPNPHGHHEVNHIDGVKTHNTPDNLEWSTRQGNMRHAWGRGLMDNARLTGEKHHRAKLTEADIRAIRAAVPVFEDNATKYEVASHYGVHICTVNDIVQRRSWKHVA